jgi:hypothetical protein
MKQESTHVLTKELNKKDILISITQFMGSDAYG